MPSRSVSTRRALAPRAGLSTPGPGSSSTVHPRMHTRVTLLAAWPGLRDAHSVFPSCVSAQHLVLLSEKLSLASCCPFFSFF